MLYNLPTPFVLSELDSILPCSEEEWSAATTERWFALRTSDQSPPTPRFQEAFTQLFEDQIADHHRHYSEFGGYILISGLLLAVLDAHRVASVPAFAGTANFEKFDAALDNWQRLWLADPKSVVSGQSTPLGAMAFNASAVYRATSVMRVKDYSRFVGFLVVLTLVLLQWSISAIMIRAVGKFSRLWKRNRYITVLG
jgi:hypothetical protein